MCGIAGFLEFSASRSASDLRDLVARMADIQAHRGPDDSGVWFDADAGVALSHRRLAVIDCDPSGHQPMVSHNRRYVVTYNGEIYNYRELACDLDRQGIKIGGGSDTGVLLAAIATWGIEDTLKRTVGMFAFAVWDREMRTMTLARDRLGIKPVFWTQQNGCFVFASQLKALAMHPRLELKLDRASVANFVRHGYVPGPHSVYLGVEKLSPGCYLHVSSDSEVSINSYWSVEDAAEAGTREPFGGDFAGAVDKTEALLHQAVTDRMMADVPLGVFLSGGIDSSLVAALVQAASSRPARTFSIGFQDAGYDESAHAQVVSNHLGTDHTKLIATPTHALDLVDDLPTWYDEPFADSSQIPTLLLSRMTREHVTVALSGDGGDEVFAGYNRYIWAERIWKTSAKFPKLLRSFLGTIAQSAPPGPINAVGNIGYGLGIPRQLGDKLNKLGRIFTCENAFDTYRSLISQWDDPNAVLIDPSSHATLVQDKHLQQCHPDTLRWMQLVDMLTYLPDDILAKVDRASMAHALEVRVPLIDHRLIAFAWTLPRDFFVRNGKSKALLREVLYRHVPQPIVDRPKMGFGVPLAFWLRGPLRDWAEDLLSPRVLESEGIFNVRFVRKAMDDHIAGKRNMAYGLWTLLMFQCWRRAHGASL